MLTDEKFGLIQASEKKAGIEPIKLSRGGYNEFDTYRSESAGLNSPHGLYTLAQQAGLGEEADRMLRKSGGESQEFLSGGLLMDAMDILNAASYGVVGMVKGKGFAEGVRDRESLSDEDSLGRYGVMGKIAGFIGDIVLDPFTYVAPWKIVSKVPGLTKTAEEGVRKMFGDLTKIEVQGQKTFVREGGWTPLTFLTKELVYGSAVDKTFLNGEEALIGRSQSIVSEAEDIITQTLDVLKPDLFNKTLSRSADGRTISRSLEELQRELSSEQLEQVRKVYDMRDSLMERLVDLGVLTKETADEHWGTYLTQTYQEILEKRATLPRGKSGIGLNKKGRVENLTPERMAELGQVDDAALVWGQTLIKQATEIKRAELNKFTSEGYALTEDMIPEYLAKGGKMENLHKVSDSTAYALDGKKISLSRELGRLKSAIKEVKKERVATGADLRDVERTLGGIEKKLESLRGATEEQLSEAWSGVRQILRDSSITPGPMKKFPASLGQQALAAPLAKWLNRGSKNDRLARETISSEDLWKQFRDTKEGIAIMRAFNDPQLMYQWKSPVEFLDAVRYPDKSTVFKSDLNRVEELTTETQDALIAKSEKNAREVGRLTQEKTVLSETNLKMIQEAADRVEQEYADLLWQKSTILKDLEKAKYNGLAGKYVSKDIWEVLKGEFEPTKEFGESLVMWFKHAKVIWNPASHVRNAISASIQNWWKLGMGPWEVNTYFTALNEFKNNGKYLNQMRALGFNERSGAIGELMDNFLLNKSLVGQSYLKQLGGIKQVRKFGKHMDKLMMNSYAHIDNVAKVAGYIHNIKKGMPPEEAYAKAIAATFNYSQVTPFVHKMRRNLFGVPFITFALKAVPLVATTVANNPGRISVFGKARNTLFEAAGVQGEQEAEAMPAWMRDDAFMLRVPWKDSEGRSMYFDMSYIIPVGAVLDGSFFKRPEQLNPVVNLISELSANETFSGSKIFKESDDIEKVIADISVHVLKLGMPKPMTDFMSDGYDSDGERREPPTGWGDLAGVDTQDLGSGERTYYQKIFQALGVGAMPYDLESRETSLANAQKENLSKLLQENGVLKAYQSNYIPADSEFSTTQKKIEGGLYDKEVRPIGR